MPSTLASWWRRHWTRRPRDAGRSSSPRPRLSSAATGCCGQSPCTPGGIIGAVSLYRRLPGPLVEPLDSAQFLADAAAAALIRDPLAFAAYTTSADPGGWSSRAQVHQATGMPAGKLHISIDDAFALLRSHAFAAGLELADVAAAVVEHRLDLSSE